MINKAALFLTTCLFCTLGASQESEQSQKLDRLIIKTDLEGVKKILPQVILTIETKQRLIDLANDIMLMRCKTEEIYSPSYVNSQNISMHDKETLKKIFSKRAIEDIKQINNALTFWSCVEIVSFITFFISIAAGADSQYAGLTGRSWVIASIVGTCLSLICLTGYHTILQKKVCSTLRQLYCDSIEIKTLIAKAPVTV